MTSSTPTPPASERRRTARCEAFTLIELILVMTLVTMAAALAAPAMGAFFRGRSLDHEARRLLSLTHYGRSRAIAEGVPVELWIDQTSGRYGLGLQAGFTDGDSHAMDYELDSQLTISSENQPAPVPYDSDIADDAVTPPTAAIVFQPDGQLSPTSASRIVIRQGDEASLALTRNRLGTGYELLPTDALPAP